MIKMVNTAATAMIIPIVMAIINELRASKSQVEQDETNSIEFVGVENKSFEKHSEMLEMSRSSEVIDSEDNVDEVTVGIEQETVPEPDDISKDDITDFERGIILSVPYSCSIGIGFIINSTLVPSTVHVNIMIHNL